MKVDLYEKIWIGIAGVLIVVFLGAIFIAAASHAAHPPSGIETIDPETIYETEEFGSPGVRTEADGRTVVSVVAAQFSFDPDPIEVPAGKPITFRLTSPDVIHGFLVAGTNANAMVIPGYVTEFSVTFPRPGEYLVLCHEYCGLVHHEMYGTLIAYAEEATP